MIYLNQKKEREDKLMTNTTIVTGYNEQNEVIIRIETTYENRFETINRVMDMEEVTHMTTKTIIKA